LVQLWLKAGEGCVFFSLGKTHTILSIAAGQSQPGFVQGQSRWWSRFKLLAQPEKTRLKSRQVLPVE
jgi:hypothetical protein